MSKKKHNPQSLKRDLQRVNSLVDVVIPVHGRFDLLEECLKALPSAAGNDPYNVICVDNASEKREADEFYTLHTEVTVIRNKENVGFPAACNQAARRKSSPLILFLNSDVILEPDAIHYMALRMDDPKIGIVGAKLLYPKDSQDRARPAGKVQHVGISTDIHGRWNHILMGWSPDNPRVVRVDAVPAVTGAALMIRRNLWNKVGGFDEVYGIGTWEDIDLAMSVAGLGHMIVVEQKSLGTHYVSATASKYDIRYPLAQNQSIFIGKWQGKFAWTDWLYW